MTATEDEQAAPAGSLSSTASRAFGWSILNTAVSRFGTLAIGIALARLLGPAEFGTYAVATVAMVAVLSFNELGVSLAIVRWPGDPRLIAPTVTTISVVASAVLVLAMCLAAPAFAGAMGDPQATNVVRLMSVAILVNGIVAAPAALMQREFKQGRRMAVDQVNTWLGAVVSLVLAVLGFGAMSLAIGRIVGAVVSGAMFVAWSPLPFRFGFDRTHARGLIRFGLPLAGASVVVFASSYSDQLVAGHQLGAVALGVYVLAFNLSSWPVSIFSQPLRSVAPAAFARLQHAPAEMNRAFGVVLGLLASVALPACALLAGASAPLVGLAYGSKWAAAASVLSWLAVFAAFRIGFELAYDFLVVRGKTRAILVAQITWLAVSIPALLLGARWGGLPGIALSQVVVAAAVMVPLYATLIRRCGIALLPLGRRLLVPVLVSGAIGAAALAISDTVAGAFTACALSGTVGLVGLAGLVYLRRHDIAAARGLRSAGPTEPA